jgi:hypothetical protein
MSVWDLFLQCGYQPASIWLMSRFAAWFDYRMISTCASMRSRAVHLITPLCRDPVRCEPVGQLRGGPVTLIHMWRHYIPGVPVNDHEASSSSSASSSSPSRVRTLLTTHTRTHGTCTQTTPSYTQTHGFGSAWPPVLGCSVYWVTRVVHVRGFVYAAARLLFVTDP